MLSRLIVAGICALSFSGCASTLEALYAVNNEMEGAQYEEWDQQDANDVNCGTSTRYGVLVTVYGVRGNQTYLSFHNKSSKTLNIIGTFTTGTTTEVNLEPGVQSPFVWKPIPVIIDEWSWACVGARAPVTKARSVRILQTSK